MIGSETLSDVRRMTSVQALSPCRLIQFASADIGAARAHIYRELVASTLRAIPLFHGIKPDVFEALVPMFETHEYDSGGQLLLQEGHVPDAFYILLLGTATVERGSAEEGTLKVIAAFEGQASEPVNSYPFFGELGLLTATPTKAMASVYTTSAAKVLSVPRAHFHKFLRLVKDFEQRVTRIAALRCKQTEHILAQKRSAFRVAGGSVVAVARLANMAGYPMTPQS